MVEINGRNYPDEIRLKGTDRKINLKNLEGLQRTEQNKAIFDMVDHNKDGIIDKNEALSLQGNLLTASNGNGILSKREANHLYGKQSNTFDAITALANQQAAFENNQEYVEIDGNKTSHINKSRDLSYTQIQNNNGTIISSFSDGSQEIKQIDGSYQIVKNDGTVEYYDKNKRKTSVMQNGNTTTFPDENSSITKNQEGQILQTITVKDGKIINTKFEYQDGKTIEREYSDVTEDAPLTQITVKEQKDGHSIDTKYATEEDMTNNKPSEVITDAHNSTKKVVTKYTYNEDGTYSTETIDSAGNKTVKKFKADGTEITEPEAPTTHTVVKGESITSIVKNALAEQGITEPTAEQLTTAKKEFLELNKDIVKTYNGRKAEWKGNKFFYPDDVVKIPTFVKTEDTEVKEPPKQNENVETDTPNSQTIARQQELQQTLGENYKVEIAEDGTLVVKDIKGNICQEATKKANNIDNDNNDEDIDIMMAYDVDKNNSLDETEYTNFIIEFIESAEIEINDSNREQIMNLIKDSFNSMDTINKDNLLTKEELQQNAKKIIEKLADSVNDYLDNN